MKRYLAIIIMIAIPLGFAGLGCDDEGGTCHTADVDQCRAEQADCMSGSTSETVEACGEVFCDCLDDRGCDDYLEAAGC